jgi:drug/metabolite transporter (DMT)-like permease
MPRLLSEKNRIVIAFACVYITWGSTYGAIEIAGRYFAPPLVGALRSILSTVLMCGICVARGTSLRVTKGVAWRLALVGVLFMTVNNVMLIWGETKVASGLSSLVIAVIPILVALMETALPGGERLNARGWFGTLLGAVGMVALLWPTLNRAAGGGDRRGVFGFAILAGAALAFAVGSVLARRFHFKVDTFVATTWQIGAAGLCNLMIATAAGSFRTAHWTREGLLAIAFLSTVGSVVGLTAYTYLLQHVAVTKVATYAFVNPMIAVLIGVALFGERLAGPEVLGMVLILCAVALVILSRAAPTGDPVQDFPIEE